MIIAVANQKGGVGKTTTVAYVASAMAAHGCRVLAVDLDPQASLTFFLGHDETALDAQERGLHHAIRSGDLGGVILSGAFDLVPSGIALAKSETELLSEPNGSLLLKELLEPLRDRYDYILLDCPPSLGMLTVNALNAANGVLLPVKTQLLSLIGLTQILETIRKVRRRANPQLKVVGILPTMHHARNAHDAEVLKEIAAHYSELPIFEPIPETTRLARAAGFTVESGSPPLFHEAYTRVASRLIGDKNA
jgi:chromosome partitioning protein